MQATDPTAETLELRANNAERFNETLTAGGRALTFATLYFASGILSNVLAFAFGSVHVLWFSTGVALAGLLLLGVRFWPVVFVADFLLNIANAYDIRVSAGVALGNGLESLIAALFLTHLAGRRRSFRSVQDVLLYVLIISLATAVSASIGTMSLALGGSGLEPDMMNVWSVWWTGDIVSCLTIVPAVFAIRARPWRSYSMRLNAEGFLLLAVMLVVGAMVLEAGVVLESMKFPWAFPLSPIIIWSVLRFELLGAVTAVLLGTSVAMARIALSRRPL